MNEHAERYCRLMRAARDLIVLARSACDCHIEYRNLVKQSLLLVAETKRLATDWLAKTGSAKRPHSRRTPN